MNTPLQPDQEETKRPISALAVGSPYSSFLPRLTQLSAGDSAKASSETAAGLSVWDDLKDSAHLLQLWVPWCRELGLLGLLATFTQAPTQQEAAH